MEAKVILEQQKQYFQSGATRNVGLLKKLLVKLREEILVREHDIYEALHKDFKKSKSNAKKILVRRKFNFLKSE